MDIRKMIENGTTSEEIESQLLTLDSEFRFKCRKCGKCCKNQDTILFNSRDIYNIARVMGKAPKDVIEEYAEVYIGSGSHIPVVHMVPRGPNRACPFLKDGLCSIHDSKPIVCALFPLGRVIVNATMEGSDIDHEEIRYLLNDIDCGSRKRINTVRDWLARFGIQEHDEFFLLWSKVVATTAETVRMMEDCKASQSTIEFLWNTIFAVLYLAYDTSIDFMLQFERNAKSLLDVCHALQESAKDGTHM